MTAESPVRVAVTGGSGFMGTNLVSHYLESGAIVRNLDHDPPRDVRQRTAWTSVDVLDGAALRDEIKGFEPDLVVHMAARTDLRGSSVDAYRVNTDGVSNLIAAIRATPSIRRAIFFSSRMVCRIGYVPIAENDYCPPNAYGQSKMIGEKIVRSASDLLPWVIVRPTSIWGPWFDVPYRTFFDTIARGRFFHTAKSVCVPKSFGFVGNSVYQVKCLANAPLDVVDRRTLYLADYPPLVLGSWSEMIRRQLDAPRIRKIPFSLLQAAARAGDLAARGGMREPPLTTFRLSNLLTPMVYDMGPLEQVVGDLPYTLEEGVALTVAWMQHCAQR